MNLQQVLTEAVSLHGQGQLNEAEKRYRYILHHNPNHVDATHYLGVIAMQVGQPKAGAELISQALEHLPEDSGMLTNLANCQHQMGNLKAAISSQKKALSSQPNNHLGHANLGNMLMQAERFEEAISHYQCALEIEPSLVDARRNLALAYCEHHHFSQAIEQIQLTLEYSPDALEVRSAFADILKRTGQLERSKKELEDLCKQFPDNPHLIHNFSITLSEIGEHVLAIQQARLVVTLAPEFIEGKLNLAALLKELGNFEESEQLARQVLECESTHPKALVLLSQIRQFDNANDKDFAAMRAAQQSPSQTQSDRISLGYSIGDVYHKLQEYHSAFLHYEQANTLAKTQKNYNVEDDIAAIRNVQNCFDKDIYERTSYRGAPSIKPIFIVGMPRSGSTLAEQILASHSNVADAGEVPFLARSINEICELKHGLDSSIALAQCSDSDLDKVAKSYTKALSVFSNNASHITDKMLINFVHIGWIKLLFPNAKIVHCRREALNTCWSIYKHDFSKHGHYYAHDQVDIARFYKAYEDIMSHWSGLFKEQIFHLDYEALVADQEGVTHSLLNYCELPFKEECLRFFERRKRVATLSATQVRQPIYRSSVNSAEAYQKWLTPMIDVLKKTQ